MNSRRTVLLFGLGVALATAPAFAHHGTNMYEMAHPVTITGVVKRFEWINPHAYVYLDVKDDKGNTVEWAVEMMSLNHLKSYGWSRNTVKPGDVISCTGGAAKSGLPAMLSSIMKLADGREIKS
jgi:hypothetical protein